MSIAFHSDARDPSTKKRERGMYEEFEIEDIGDSGEETKQFGPGGYPDSVYGLGRASGRIE
jgi:hypothetical protein